MLNYQRLLYYHGFTMVLPWSHHGFSMVLPMISRDLISSLVFYWAMVDLCLDESSNFGRFMTSSRQLPSANRAMRGHSACHHPGPPDALLAMFHPVLVFCPNYYINQLNTLPVEATVNTNLCEYPDFKHSHTVIRV